MYFTHLFLLLRQLFLSLFPFILQKDSLARRSTLWSGTEWIFRAIKWNYIILSLSMWIISTGCSIGTTIILLLYNLLLIKFFIIYYNLIIWCKITWVECHLIILSVLLNLWIVFYFNFVNTILTIHENLIFKILISLIKFIDS